MGKRVLGIMVVVLAGLCAIELMALRRMRLEMARLRAENVAYGLDSRSEEIARAGLWLHGWMQRPDGGSRAGGLCANGVPDIESIRRLIFGVYLPRRASGDSEAAAREAVIRSK
jgi:hypothetical protein